jgi:hypothetical protein
MDLMDHNMMNTKEDQLPVSPRHTWLAFKNVDLERDFDLWNTRIGVVSRRRMTGIFVLFAVMCITCFMLMFFGPYPNFGGSWAIGVYLIVSIVLIMPCFLSLVFGMACEVDDHKYSVQATGINRPLAFSMFCLFVPAMCFFWYQLFLGQPPGSNIHLLVGHPFSFRIVDGFTIMGQLCISVHVSLVYFAIFRPLFPWACAFTCWEITVNLAFVLQLTKGFTSVSKGGYNPSGVEFIQTDPVVDFCLHFDPIFRFYWDHVLIPSAVLNTDADLAFFP